MLIAPTTPPVYCSCNTVENMCVCSVKSCPGGYPNRLVLLLFITLPFPWLILFLHLHELDDFQVSNLHYASMYALFMYIHVHIYVGLGFGTCSMEKCFVPGFKGRSLVAQDFLPPTTLLHCLGSKLSGTYSQISSKEALQEAAAAWSLDLAVCLIWGTLLVNVS